VRGRRTSTPPVPNRPTRSFRRSVPAAGHHRGPDVATTTHQELLSHATDRLRSGGFEVGAAFERDLTGPDRDEARVWRFLVVVPGGDSAYVEFLATRIPYGVRPAVEPLEGAVEHFVACNYPAEARLATLRADSEGSVEPIVLPLAGRRRRASLAAA
jgi:hypothetical protein